MNYFIRAVDEHGVAIIKMYESEDEFLRMRQWYMNCGLDVECYVRKWTWERYEEG